MSNVEWPVLVLDQTDDIPQTVAPRLEWKGEPLDLPTMGEWRVEMGQGVIANVTITIPIVVRQR